MFNRSLRLPVNLDQTFILWGPRQTGKSTLLRQTYPEATYIDLLKTDEFIRYTERPSRLREEILAFKQELEPKKRPIVPVVIDEIQKIPQLLDEIHWLIENANCAFALCGSSARKLRRSHANLLGGRALRYELFGFVSDELGAPFNCEKLLHLLNHGYLPRHYLGSSPRRMLQAYVQDYLKEEIAAEGFVRNLPAFSSFLTAASLSDTELVNYSTIARDCGVSNVAVREHFQILIDTLLGRFLPAYTRRQKRRVIQAPKFYFSDVGVVNHLAKRGQIASGGELFGKAFENWVHHEIQAHAQYHDTQNEFSYWRLASGIEVDFIVNDMEYALEVKGAAKITSDHLKGLRELIKDQTRIKRRFVVCMEPKARLTEDGIEILPAAKFVEKLWSGKLFV